MCVALAMEVQGNSLVVVRGLNMAIGVRGGVSEAWSRWRCSLEARFGLGHSAEVHVGVTCCGGAWEMQVMILGGCRCIVVLVEGSAMVTLSCSARSHGRKVM